MKLTLMNDGILKPCPFCGGTMTLVSSSKTKTFTFSHKGLRNCPFFKFEMSWDVAKSIADAKELWNMRGER